MSETSQQNAYAGAQAAVPPPGHAEPQNGEAPALESEGEQNRWGQKQMAAGGYSAAPAMEPPVQAMYQGEAMNTPQDMPGLMPQAQPEGKAEGGCGCGGSEAPAQPQPAPNGTWQQEAGYAYAQQGMPQAPLQGSPYAPAQEMRPDMLYAMQARGYSDAPYGPQPPMDFGPQQPAAYGRQAESGNVSQPVSPYAAQWAMQYGPQPVAPAQQPMPKPPYEQPVNGFQSAAAYGAPEGMPYGPQPQQPAMAYAPQPDMGRGPQAGPQPYAQPAAPYGFAPGYPPAMGYNPQAGIGYAEQPATGSPHGKCSGHSAQAAYNAAAGAFHGSFSGNQNANPGFDPFAFAAQFGGPADPKHLEKHFGQLMELYGDFMQGKTDPAKIMNFITSTGTHFWKGAIVGALATFLLTNKSVRSAVKDGVSGIFGGGKSTPAE